MRYALTVLAFYLTLSPLAAQLITVDTQQPAAIAAAQDDPYAEPRETLEMASLPGSVIPSDFVLTNALGASFGPFVFRDGTRLGSGASALLLHPVGEDHFTLEDPRNKSLMGPLELRDGCALTIQDATLFLVRQPSRLVGRLQHADALPLPPLAAIERFDAPLQQGLWELRASFQRLAARLNAATSKIVYEGVPTIVGPGGSRSSGTVTRSLRDREEARNAADASATLQLEQFLRKRMRGKIAIDAAGAFVSPDLPPGPYLFCALRRVRDRDSTTASRSKLAVWWTLVEVRAHDRLELHLDADDAIGWRDVFRR